MLKVAPESTRNDNLLCLSFKNNNLEPCEKDIAVAVLISAVSSLCGVCFIGRARRFPASGREKRICEICAGIFVVVPTNSIVIFLRAVMRGLRPAAAVGGWRVTGGGCPGGFCICHCRGTNLTNVKVS